MDKNLNPEDYYLSEEGYITFTKEFHIKRGYCCNNSCKHCPYKTKKNVKNTSQKR